MSVQRRRVLAAGVLAAGGACLGAAISSTLARPSGPVILTVRGKVSITNGNAGADFDMAMLERMPQRSILTKTPWYDSARRFTGPLLRDVLAASGAKGSTIRAIALNDYKVEMPFDDPQKIDVVMARLLDDRPMLVREKGPLFIIYPFDDLPELRSAVYFARCAWQLRTLEVV
jgi:hypothetical protein